MPDPSLPSGTVTFLFTDIEGSTKLWERYPDAMKTALARHDALLRGAIEAHGGYVFKTIGDAFCAAFATAPDALSAALAAQQSLSAQTWGETGPLRVRTALHTGAAEERGGDYFGPPLNRISRLLSSGHGGQILLSVATVELIRDALPEGASLRALGSHLLKDLQRPEQVFQLLHSDLPSNFPPLKSLDTLPNNLPGQLTSFIGREREIAEVKRLLATTRLLTLTGAGGCGKTRLALQAAADSLDEFPGGVWLVELAPISDPELAPQGVASALGVREEGGYLLTGGGVSEALSVASGGRTMLSKLLDYLQSKQLLLILDNCEHLIGECATLSDTLLRGCPNLKILATSREALGISGETAWRVPSLSLPDPRRLPSVENLTIYETVRLFIDRALAVLPTFTVTNQNAPAVAQICHRLDGIPLAIELAAARVKVLSVEQIAKRLDDRFRLLTGGSRTALPRQQTLRALIDWSYDLLSEAERTVFRRLSVFVGGWTIEAAEAICGDAVPPRAGAGGEDDVLDLLTQLVNKSLVVVGEEGAETRYRLLETIRQYARDKLLESGEAAALHGRHRDWFLALAEQDEPELGRLGQTAWLDRMEAEHDNLRAALEWSIGGGDAEAELRLVGALHWFWWVRGYWSEGRKWLEGALSRGKGASAPARAKALCGAGNLAGFQGDYAQAKARLEESLVLFRELGNKGRIAWSLGTLGLFTGSRYSYNLAVELCEEGLALSREIGDKSGISDSLTLLGIVVSGQGDYGRVVELFEESLSLSRESGYKWGIALALFMLGAMARNQNDYGRAEELFEESLALLRELGVKKSIADSLINLGDVRQHQGDYDRAKELYKESITMHRGLDNRWGIASCLIGLGGVAVAEGQQERAARLFGAAEALFEAIGVSLKPSDRPNYYDRSVAAVRAELGEEVFAKAWSQGRKMTVEEAIGYALSTNQ
jgi:predicted ATPase/class 3 adenylate cyclase